MNLPECGDVIRLTRYSIIAVRIGLSPMEYSKTTYIQKVMCRKKKYLL